MSQKYVLWSADGVVFSEDKSYIFEADFREVVSNQIKETYTLLSQQDPAIKVPLREQINQYMQEGKNERDIFKTLQGESSTRVYEEYAKQERARKGLDTQLLPHVKETVIAFNKRGYKNLIIGFRSVTSIKDILKAGGIDEYFHVVPTHTVGLRLPNDAIWEALIVKEFPTITKEDTVMIAKESVEIVFAEKVGIKSAWLRSSAGDLERCTESNPTKTLYSMSQCSEVVVKLLNDEALLEQDVAQKSHTPTLR